MEFSDHGVVFAEGRKCWMKGLAKLSGLEKITEAELEEIRNDFDPIEAPPGPYKLQPENQGEAPNSPSFHLTSENGFDRKNHLDNWSSRHGQINICSTPSAE